MGRAEPGLSDRAPNSRAHLLSSPTVASRYKARKFVLGISRVRELETKLSEEVVRIGHTEMLAPALAPGAAGSNPDAASDHLSTAALRPAHLIYASLRRATGRRAHSGSAYANLVDASRDRQPWIRRRPRSELGVGDRLLRLRSGPRRTTVVSPLRSRGPGWREHKSSRDGSRRRARGSGEGGSGVPLVPIAQVTRALARRR